MPKIIENVHDRAIAAARNVLLEEGYGAMTIRRVAAALEIAPATIYNYFPSKENLAACVMLEDWQRRMQSFETGESVSAARTVRDLFDTVQSFSRTYASSWMQYGADDQSASMRRQYRPALVRQLAGYILRTLPAERAAAEPWLAPFLADLILRFGADGAGSYDDLEPAVTKLLN